MSAESGSEKRIVGAPVEVVEISPEEFAEHEPGTTHPYDLYRRRDETDKAVAHRIPEMPKTPDTLPGRRRVGRTALLVAGVTLAVGSTIGIEYFKGDFVPTHTAVGTVECSGNRAVTEVLVNTGSSSNNAVVTPLKYTKAIATYNLNIGPTTDYSIQAGCGGGGGYSKDVGSFDKSPTVGADVSQTISCETATDKINVICGLAGVELVPLPTPTTLPAGS